MQLSSAQYDAWLWRARTGQAHTVVAEVEHLLHAAQPAPPTHSVDAPRDAASRARAGHLHVVALLRAGRVDDAATAAGRCLAHAQRSETLGLVALALSARAAVLALSRDEPTAGLREYQQAERLLAGTAPEDLHDPDWVSALVDMWGTAAALGLRTRAAELGRVCHGLTAWAGAYERYLVAERTAQEVLERALSPVRQPPYEPDRALLRRAHELANQAEALIPRPPALVTRPQTWEPLVDAYLAETPAAAGAAAEALAELLVAAEGELGWLEPVVRGARLRALRRAGRHADAAAARHEDARIVATLSSHPASSESVLGYLWERAVCVLPGLEDPAGDQAPLTSFLEARRHTHERLVRSLLDLNLTAAELDAGPDTPVDPTRTDELTGVLNRRGLQPHLDRSAADSDGRAWTLLLVEVDDPPVGDDDRADAEIDDLLQTLGLALRRASRSEDLVARVGNGAFVVLADMTSDGPAPGSAVGARILSTLHGLDDTGRLRVSVGVAVRTKPVDPAEWVRLADQAADDARRAGGDQVSEAGKR